MALEDITVHVLLYYGAITDHIHLILERSNGTYYPINRWNKAWENSGSNYSIEVTPPISTQLYELFKMKRDESYKSEVLPRKIVPIEDDFKKASCKLKFFLPSIDFAKLKSDWIQYQENNPASLTKNNCAAATTWFLQTWCGMPSEMEAPIGCYHLFTCLFWPKSKPISLPSVEFHRIKNWLQDGNIPFVEKPNKSKQL